MAERSPSRLTMFGEFLRYLRRRVQLTQGELGIALDCSAALITRLEKGERLPDLALVKSAYIQALGLEHEPELAARLIELAAAARYEPRGVPASSLPAQGARLNNLPRQLTSFIGRESEITHLTTLLADPACRLVTVTGQGGIGKTRIAIELATRLLERDSVQPPAFPDGIWFVALQAVESPARMVSAIIDVLQCPAPGAADARDHLFAYLRARQMLLVLDNFEHLCGWADLVTAILAAAPQVKLLVTSREALNLEQEWRYPLGGLTLQGDSGTHEQMQSSAECLFVERARHVFPTFDLAAEREAVQRICQLVEGIPLAIELAVTWTRVLSCATIADEIASDLAFLTSSNRNAPDRHRSMQAVFNRSWELLGQEERRVFAQLSVFRGGFQRHAAEQVAGATLPVLAALTDKSLLCWEPGDRYRIHELLRQYAAERLEQSIGDAADVCDRHCAYYTDYLGRRADDINGRRQRQAQAEIAAELENERVAWQYAVQHRRIPEIQRAAYTFYLFHDFRSRYREGADLFEQAAQLFDKNTPTIEVGPTLSELLVCIGWISIRLGQLGRAREVLERSQAILTRLGIAPRPGPGTDPLVALGTLANVLGEYTEAAWLGEEARRCNEARGDLGNLMYAYYVLTNSAFALGQYAEASRYGAQACELADQLHDRWFLAYLVADLGDIARAVGDYAEAVRQYQLSYVIREEFGDPEGIAVALVRLGQMSLWQGNADAAQAQFLQSLATYREIGDRGGEATALHGLGMTSATGGQYEAAAQYLCEALQIAVTIGYASRLHAILAGAAEVFLLSGQPPWAAELLVPILRHPASDRETCDLARSLLARCEAILLPDQYTAATQGKRVIDLPAVFTNLRTIIGSANRSSADWMERASTQVPIHHLSSNASHAQPPTEPLTDRERSVLRLMADGQSNQKIAAQLIITPGTAKWYASQIFRKLGVHSRTQAIARARELGVLS